MGVYIGCEEWSVVRGTVCCKSTAVSQDIWNKDFGANSNTQEAATLKGAEQEKRNRYGRMYDLVGVQAEGVAMDLAGDIGPGFRAFLKRCEVIAGFARPLCRANWSAGSTFFSAWWQRYVASVQIKNAEIAL